MQNIPAEASDMLGKAHMHIIAKRYVLAAQQQQQQQQPELANSCSSVVWCYVCFQTQTNPLDQNNDDDGLHFLTLLMECAVAISVDNLNEAQRMLLELNQVVSPYKPSCAERIVAYFAKAMASRVMNSWLGVFPPLIDHKTIHSSFQIFNNISPFIKFAHFTSNQAILEAVHYCDNIHIIDLDIMQSY